MKREPVTERLRFLRLISFVTLSVNPLVFYIKLVFHGLLLLKKEASARSFIQQTSSEPFHLYDLQPTTSPDPRSQHPSSSFLGFLAPSRIKIINARPLLPSSRFLLFRIPLQTSSETTTESAHRPFSDEYYTPPLSGHHVVAHSIRMKRYATAVDYELQ